jgi:hypothetical protein
MMDHQKGSGCDCVKGVLIVATLSSPEQTRPDLCRAHVCGAGPEAASVARRRPWRLGGGTGGSEPSLRRCRRCLRSGADVGGPEEAASARRWRWLPGGSLTASGGPGVVQGHALTLVNLGLL